MKSLFNYFAPKEEEKSEEIVFSELKQKFLKQIENLKKPTFGERHHAWIRHVKVEFRATVDQEMDLIISFQGVITLFNAKVVKMTEKLLENEFASQDAMEDYLEKVFFSSHSLNDRYEVEYTRKLDDYCAKLRNAVYLDYKFFKGMPK